MDLFGSELNILPYDGDTIYYGRVIDLGLAKYYYDIFLKEIKWKNDEAIMFGKLIYTKRKVAWYGEKSFRYTYSNTTKQALPFTSDLLKLKQIIEQKTGETFNSCLFNLYHNGEESMAWHSDGEKDLKKNGAIASFSLGASRKFSFKHKESKKVISINLDKGSLLVMKGTTQTNWLHRLPV